MKPMYRVAMGLAAAAIVCSTGCSNSEPENKQQALDALRKERQEIDGRIAELEKQVGKPAQAEAGRQIAVSVAQIAPTTFQHFISVQGIVETDRLAQVSPKISGVVTKINVREGDRVAAGQVLAELDNSVAEAQVQALQAQYNFAKTVYEKQKRVWEQKAGSEIQYLEAKNNMETLGKQIDAAKEQVAMGTIRAPFAGVVDKVVPKVGENISPGTEAFRVVNLSNLRVTAEVSEAYLGKVKRGNPATLVFPDIKKELPAQVGTVSQAVNTTNRTFSVGLPLKGATEGVRPNMICVVKINDVTVERALTVPVNSIRTIEEKSYLFVVKEENGKQIARMREVTTGLSSEGVMQITGGVEAGENVVTLGMNDLADGDIVRPM